MGRQTIFQIEESENQKDSSKKLEPNSNDILEEEYKEDETDEYDDRWDYLYDDIAWQNEKIKIRKSERKENKQSQHNTRL